MRTREPCRSVEAAGAADTGGEGVTSVAVGAETLGEARKAGAADVDCGCVGGSRLPGTISTAVKNKPSATAAEANSASSCRMHPVHHA
jgi:hypothetical protein